MLVVQLSIDGIVLHCNPETQRVTGYERCELVGKNFWATLFPGRLFAQVPRFISPTAPSPLLRDTPMTIRTREGRERIIAFSRFFHTAGGALDLQDVPSRTLVCIGVDLTDRLIDSDKVHGAADDGFVPFGPNVGNAGAVDGEIVTPLAISPPALSGPIGAGPNATHGREGAAEVIRQVQDYLALIDARMAALHEAAARGELERLAALASAVGEGARTHADFSGRAAAIESAAAAPVMAPIVPLVEQIVALYRVERR
jgi:PAS domain S-box-containing protein